MSQEQNWLSIIMILIVTNLCIIPLFVSHQGESQSFPNQPQTNIIQPQSNMTTASLSCQYILNTTPAPPLLSRRTWPQHYLKRCDIKKSILAYTGTGHHSTRGTCTQDTRASGSPRDADKFSPRLNNNNILDEISYINIQSWMLWWGLSLVCCRAIHQHIARLKFQ